MSGHRARTLRPHGFSGQAGVAQGRRVGGPGGSVRDGHPGRRVWEFANIWSPDWRKRKSLAKGFKIGCFEEVSRLAFFLLKSPRGASLTTSRTLYLFFSPSRKLCLKGDFAKVHTGKYSHTKLFGGFFCWVFWFGSCAGRSVRAFLLTWF